MWFSQSISNGLNWLRHVKTGHGTHCALADSLSHQENLPVQRARHVDSVGTLFIELASRLCRNEYETQRTDKELDSLEQSRYTFRTRFDGAYYDLSRICSTNRPHLTHVIGLMVEQRDRAIHDLNDVQKGIEEKHKRLETLREHGTRDWKDMFGLAQQYCNSCLDVDFEEPWSLNAAGCWQLMNCYERERLIDERGRQVHKLQAEFLQLRLMEGRAGYHRSTERLTEQQHRIKEAEDLLKYSERRQLTARADLLWDYCQFLKQPARVGSLERIFSLDTFPEEGLSIEGDASARSSSSAPIHDDYSGATQDTDDQYRRSLQGRYTETRSELEYLQLKLHDLHDKTRCHDVLYFLTFTNLTIERYQALVQRQSKKLEARINDTEESLLDLREEMVQQGIPTPQDPEPSISPPASRHPSQRDARSQRTVDSRDWHNHRTQKLKRINQYRHGVTDPARPDQTPSPLQSGQTSIARLSGPSPGRSLSRTPESGRKRKVEELIRDQESRRDEFENMSGPKPKYRRES